MTKTEARRWLADIRGATRMVAYAINTNDGELLRGWTGLLAGYSGQLQTDIFDRELGTGLRGVVDEDDL